MHILPHQFLELPREERAFIIASIQIRIEHEADEAKKDGENAAPEGEKKSWLPSFGEKLAWADNGVPTEVYENSRFISKYSRCEYRL